MAKERPSYAARQIASLAFSPLEVGNVMGRLRAARWHNVLLGFGEALPWVLIHDLGLALTGEGRPSRHGAAAASERLRGETPAGLIERYAALLGEIGESELARAVREERLGDDVVAALVAKLIASVAHGWAGRPLWRGATALPLDPARYAQVDVASRDGSFDVSPVVGLLEHVLSRELVLVTAVEQIDLDTVKLLGLLGAPGTGGFDLADLLRVLSSPEANGVVNFSLDLLPSVLETRRAVAVQMFSIDGYAGLSRRGSVDSLLLSELAYDDELFEQKIADDQLLYFAHEKQRTEERRPCLVLIDGSASMRGEREVFGRALALTICKKVALLGQDVSFRFFDSRLYDRQPFLDEQVSACRMLAFRSERGRNYGRVFRQLAVELGRERRSPIVYLITHGQCHVEAAIVAEVTRAADVHGIFILPSAELHLTYLDLLKSHQIVDRETLTSRRRSVDRALQIVEEVKVVDRR